MKYLTIIRHAKSSWSEAGLADHDRPLNARGKAAAPAIGKFLARTYFGAGELAQLLPSPQLILSSTASRTMATSELLSAQLSVPPAAIRYDRQLYLAERPALLRAVRELDDDISHALIVAHNPGIHEFCDAMLSRASIPRMPTCAAVIVSLPHLYWGLADWQEATLIGYITPKALERRFPTEYGGISVADEDD